MATTTVQSGCKQLHSLQSCVHSCLHTDQNPCTLVLTENLDELLDVGSLELLPSPHELRHLRLRRGPGPPGACRFKCTNFLQGSCCKHCNYTERYIVIAVTLRHSIVCIGANSKQKLV